MCILYVRCIPSVNDLHYTLSAFSKPFWMLFSLQLQEKGNVVFITNFWTSAKTWSKLWKKCLEVTCMRNLCIKSKRRNLREIWNKLPRSWRKQVLEFKAKLIIQRKLIISTELFKLIKSLRFEDDMSFISCCYIVIMEL